MESQPEEFPNLHRVDYEKFLIPQEKGALFFKIFFGN